MVDALERGGIVHDHRGDLTVVHVVLPADEHQIAVADARADHAVARHAQREIAGDVRRVGDLQLLLAEDGPAGGDAAEDGDSPAGDGHEHVALHQAMLRGGVFRQTVHAGDVLRAAHQRFHGAAQRLGQAAQRTRPSARTTRRWSARSGI